MSSGSVWVIPIAYSKPYRFWLPQTLACGCTRASLAKECPQCGCIHCDWLSTMNEWEFYCKHCDVRFNKQGEVVTRADSWRPKQEAA